MDTDLPSLFVFQNKQRKLFSLLNRKIKQEPSAQKNPKAIEKTAISVEV